jgi:hypothetical protein
MNDNHDAPTPFELEMAALNQLPVARQAEVEAYLDCRGRLGELDELRRATLAFHQEHDPHVMLRRIQQRRERAAQTQARDPMPFASLQMFLSDHTRSAMFAAILCVVALASLALFYREGVDAEQTSSVRPSPAVTVAASTPLADAARCDMTRGYEHIEPLFDVVDGVRVVRDQSYFRGMVACVDIARARIRSASATETMAPPAELVYACEQRYLDACNDLGTFLTHGARPFTEMKSSKEDWRDFASRQKGAKAYQRACDLRSMYGCCRLANALVEDAELRQQTGWSPEDYFARADKLASDLEDETCVRWAEPSPE